MQTATRQQIAAAYGISVQTLRNWCKREGIRLPARRLLTATELEQIAAKFGSLHGA